jgi:putative hydrolase of the HAD superfamily
MSKYEYILFDVAGTLLYKPSFFDKILVILKANGYKITKEEFIFKHKLLSETIKFPDRTDKDFYNFFNEELLYSLGVLPNNILLDKIFTTCSYLPWEKFEDTQVLEKIKQPIGIISNFNNTLRSKLDESFNINFCNIIVSEEIGISKPDLEFYKRALEIIDVDPKKILYIGDSVKLDLHPATLCGINTLVIDRDDFYPSLETKISNLEHIIEYINE